MKTMTKVFLSTALLLGFAFTTITPVAHAVYVEADVELETTGGARKDEVFPTDIFGYEDPIQDYYEYKKGCTNDCEAGFIRSLIYNAADLV